MRHNKLFLVVVLVGSVIGMVDAGYLVMSTYVFGRGPACGLSQFQCNTVLQSTYSRFLGIPLSVWGLGYYAALFVACIAYADMKKQWLLLGVRAGVIWGIVFSGWLIYVQAFVLRAWCIYCLASEATAVIMVLALVAAHMQDRRIISGVA